MNRKKIAIIGHFGGKEKFTDGQTVKTLRLYDELITHTNWDIIKVDTYYKRKNPIKLVFDTLKTLFITKDVIVLLSGNGMKVYFPLLYMYVKVFKRNVYHDVIGGNLAQYIEKNSRYQKYLNSFRGNWVETEMLKTELEDQGLKNVEVIPNFRRLQGISYDTIAEMKYGVPYRFCTFSRVMKEKGIEDAIDAVKKINKENNKIVCTLDIYGPVDEKYTERFKCIMDEADSSISYIGEVSSELAVDTIKKYYGLLFPTKWGGEGSAGTVMESFFAGVPVIATDWRCNHEMIDNGYNGLLYPSELANSLKSAIEWLITNSQNIYAIKKNCIESSKKYCPDKTIKKIIELIERESK